MKHYKSVEFLSTFRRSAPPDKREAPYWRLSDDGSGPSSFCLAFQTTLLYINLPVFVSTRVIQTHRSIILSVFLVNILCVEVWAVMQIQLVSYNKEVNL